MTVLTAFFAVSAGARGDRAGRRIVAGRICLCWSPVLVTRSMGHFSLVAAAPLAVFLLLLLKASARERPGWRDALALGATLAWATGADVYYGVYCVILGTMFVVSRVVHVAENAGCHRVRTVASHARRAHCVYGCDRGDDCRERGMGPSWSSTARVGMRSLYTPVLLLTTFVLSRVACHYRISWTRDKVTAAPGLAQHPSGSRRRLGGRRNPLALARGARAPYRPGTLRFIADVFGATAPPPAAWTFFSLFPAKPKPSLRRRPGESGWRVPVPTRTWRTSRPYPWCSLRLPSSPGDLGWRPPRWWTGVTVAFALLAPGPVRPRWWCQHLRAWPVGVAALRSGRGAWRARRRVSRW
jgi:hypothetical protein